MSSPAVHDGTMVGDSIAVSQGPSASTRTLVQFVFLAALGALLFNFHGISLHLTPWSQAIVNAIVKYTYDQTGQNKTLVLKGGRELQRCLYAFAVRSLLPGVSGVSSRLLYLKASDDGFYSLADPDAVLARLAEFAAAAAQLVAAGNLLPGAAAADSYNDFAFALPGGASETYFDLKFPLITARLADLAPLWEME